jgi:monofunctional biosynthetic peptidoglycan transglycosylase
MAKRPGSTIPRYKRRRKRSLVGRIAGWIVKLVLAFLIISALWALAYRFINPPITFTMIGDLVAGRGATRDWMPIGQIDRDMVRAAIGAEDSKFCSHSGFDVEAIEDAMKRNASGEAWFTFLIEHLWDKRRIMEVYLNLAETGIGTYGVNAGAQRYFGHDASAMSATEAARIAAILPLPKKRGAIAPKGFTRRYGNTLAARIGVVARDGLDACVYSGAPAPVNKAPPPVTKKARPLPGEEYETARPLPPVENVVQELPPASAEPLDAEPVPVDQNETAPPPPDEPSDPPSNGF